MATLICDNSFDELGGGFVFFPAPFSALYYLDNFLAPPRSYSERHCRVGELREVAVNTYLLSKLQKYLSSTFSCPETVFHDIADGDKRNTLY